jgi:hypothetical protein
MLLCVFAAFVRKSFIRGFTRTKARIAKFPMQESVAPEVLIFLVFNYKVFSSLSKAALTFTVEQSALIREIRV